MRVLFQGAGAVGIAGEGRFADSHEVAVVSRRGSSAAAAHPVRLSGLGRARRRRGPEAIRRVPVLGWTEIEASGWAVGPWTPTQLRRRHGTKTGRRRQAGVGHRQQAEVGRRLRAGVDLLVLTSRPVDLDEDLVAAIDRIGPRTIAVTSQVAGDREAAAAVFAGTSVVTFLPAFLSERIPASPAAHRRDAGSAEAEGPVGCAPDSECPAACAPDSVRYWAPRGAPAFFVSGPPQVVGRLRRDLGRLVVAVPDAALIDGPALFIPFAAELIARAGSWEEMRGSLGRPATAAAEAMRAVSGVRPPGIRALAGCVLAAAQRLAPFDLGSYASRHFLRHVRQTRDMLHGWQTTAGPGEAPALQSLIDELDRRTAQSVTVVGTPTACG